MSGVSGDYKSSFLNATLAGCTTRPPTTCPEMSPSRKRRMARLRSVAAASLTSELNGYRRSFVGSSLSARKDYSGHEAPCPPTPLCEP